MLTIRRLTPDDRSTIARRSLDRSIVDAWSEARSDILQEAGSDSFGVMKARSKSDNMTRRAVTRRSIDRPHAHLERDGDGREREAEPRRHGAQVEVVLGVLARADADRVPQESTTRARRTREGRAKQTKRERDERGTRGRDERERGARKQASTRRSQSANEIYDGHACERPPGRNESPVSRRQKRTTARR